MQNHIFKDRKEGGQKLAERLENHKNRQDMIVVALPRGGVPVAYEIAKSLNYPLEIFLVRKIGLPQNEETAMGAIAHGGTIMLNDEFIKYLNVPEEKVKKAITKAENELAQRSKLYHGDKIPLSLRGRNVILVDDGMATGATIQVAIKALKKQYVHEIIVAVPVSSDSAFAEISKIADEVISLTIPKYFNAVGSFYHDFPQVSNEEVKEFLLKSSQ